MYKYLKSYKDLENHELWGRIVAVERMERRSFVFRFYKLFENHLDISQNYCPILQEHFVIKELLKEDLLEKAPLAKIIGPRAYIDQVLILKLNNFNAEISKTLWEEFTKTSCIENSKVKFRKIFLRIEKKKFYNLLRRRIRFFNGDNGLRKWLYEFDVLHLIYQTHILKFITLCLKKLFSVQNLAQCKKIYKKIFIKTW